MNLKTHTLLTTILIVLSSCSNGSKKQAKDIDTLNDSINTINKCINNLVLNKDSIISDLKYKNDSITKILKRIKSLDLTNSVNETNFSSPLIYTDTINDEYSTRGVYYKSKDKQERFYNVRVSIINNQKRFYFIGIKFPLNPKNSIANIYELNENGDIYKIDSFDLLISEIEEELANKKDFHLNEFMLLQLDNLIIKNGRLYYYKVLKYSKKYGYKLDISERHYYEYLIGSEKKSKKINNIVYSSFVIDNPDAIMLVNPQKQIIATNLGEHIFFSKVKNWTETFEQLYVNENAYHYIYDDLDRIDFDLSDFLPDLGDDKYYDPETEDDVLIGGITWNSRKNKLYFDNSGMTYRCIWEIDLDNNKVTKTVPEHEAIHPYFFEINGKEYIAYVEENKIMICSL